MIKRIEQSITKHRLLLPGDGVLVAVSGGADSVSLLCAMNRLSAVLGITVAVGHLNHRIRGRASNADAAFVEKLARRLNLPYAGAAVDVPKLAKHSGLSLEMAARKARYEFLAEAAHGLKASVIATAHTLDDQAETVLLKIARGAGPRGLSGIPRESFMDGMKVVRPMLDVRRRDVEAFLKELDQDWREDKTNGDPAYLRNRVRHEVLPFLEKTLNPEIRIALVRAADVLGEEDKWLETLSAGILKQSLLGSGKELDLGVLKDVCLAARRRVVRLWLSAAGVLAEQLDYDAVARVELLMEESGTGETEVSGKWIVKKRYDRLLVEKSGRNVREVFRDVLNVPGETRADGGRLRIQTVIEPGLVKDLALKVGRLPAAASVAYSALAERKIIVRSWRKGDRMKPFGMAGSKKLQDIFGDGKVPVEHRNDIPVFECGGEIFWIPGYRIARGWEVRDPSAPALQMHVASTV